MKRNSLLVLLLLLGQSPAFCSYKYKGLKGKIYLQENQPITIQVRSRTELQFSEGCPDEIRNFFSTLWLTRIGRQSVVHLLRSRSKIFFHISDSMGCMIYKGEARTLLGVTDPDYLNKLKKDKKSPGIIKDYDGGQTWESQRITLFRGSYRYRMGDTSLLFQNKIHVTDFTKGENISPGQKDSAMQELRMKHFRADSIDKASTRALLKRKKQGPEFKNCREYYYFTGIHEIAHTTSKNIAISRRYGDAEKDPYKMEKKAARRLGKVNRSKRIHYE